jgi:hypothetical protein
MSAFALPRWLGSLIPGVLPHYFLRFYLRTFFNVLISVGMLIFLIDSVELSRRTSGIDDFTVLTAMQVAALKTPTLLMTYTQFIALIASMMALMALNARQELVIARASGVSVWQFTLPLCVGSFMIGVLAVFRDRQGRRRRHHGRLWLPRQQPRPNHSVVQAKDRKRRHRHWRGCGIGRRHAVEQGPVHVH